MSRHKNAEDAYKDGFATGKTWTANWVPGGPYILGSGGIIRSDPEWEARCEQSRLNNAEWLRGWRDGVNAKSASQDNQN